MTIEENIKDCRNQQGIKQDILADLTGIHQISILKYEITKMQPQSPQSEDFTSALRVSDNSLSGNDIAGLGLETVCHLVGTLMVLCS